MNCNQDLTEIELSVLFCLAQGLSNEEIADKLFISIHTVKAHLEAIYDKLKVSNRVQAAMKAVILELVDLNVLK